MIPAEDEPGISLFEMPRRGELDLKIGLLRMVIATADLPPRVPRRRPFDGTLLGTVTAVALLTSMVVAMVAALPPMPKLLRLSEDARARLGIAPPRTGHFLVPASIEPGTHVTAWGIAGLPLRDLGVPGTGRPDCILKEDRPRSDRRTPVSAPSTQPAPDAAGAGESSFGTRSLMEGLLAGSALGAEAAAALRLLDGGGSSESSGTGLARSGPGGGRGGGPRGESDPSIASGALDGSGGASTTRPSPAASRSASASAPRGRCCAPMSLSRPCRVPRSAPASPRPSSAGSSLRWARRSRSATRYSSRTAATETRQRAGSL